MQGLQPLRLLVVVKKTTEARRARFRRRPPESTATVLSANSSMGAGRPSQDMAWARWVVRIPGSPAAWVALPTGDRGAHVCTHAIAPQRGGKRVAASRAIDESTGVSVRRSQAAHCVERTL